MCGTSEKTDLRAATEWKSGSNAATWLFYPLPKWKENETQGLRFNAGDEIEICNEQTARERGGNGSKGELADDSDT